MEGKNNLGLPPHPTDKLVPLLGRVPIPRDLEQKAAENLQITERQKEATRAMKIDVDRIEKVAESMAITPRDLQQGHEETQAISKAAGSVVREEYQTLQDFREIPNFDRQDLIRNPEIKARKPWYRRGLLGKLWF